ncbi:MAG: cytochrome ubiquinol oxidase subunit I [Pseudonocardia sp.]|nr:cytochrome ubiquinol oxidase subunit I [Pseudonocardia sp.]
MNALDLARWQFGIVTVYHFLFVPLTIGLSFLVALMQTAWYLSGNARYLAMTKFWGKLFLINFAMGVVTGIVQEFQFGMNWSDYSRFVGDVFGAPLAIEGLIAFFLEATFIGLWIFGWDRLPKLAHLISIWMVAIATNLSAFFILAANSWMQHPVGFRINPERGRAELTSLWDVLNNLTTRVTFPHVLTASFITAAALVIGISAWHLYRRQHVEVMRESLKMGFVVALIFGVGVAVTGDIQAKVMTEQQPMKMAAAEAIWDTQQPASFSIFTIGTPDGQSELFSVRVPYLLSFMATGDPNGVVEGINDVQRQSEERFGPGDYRPIIPVTYWSFRYMIGFGVLTSALSLLGLFMMRGGRNPAEKKWFYRAALWTIPFPLIANSFGWIFTEMGRQPWVVYSQMLTRNGVSPLVGPGLVLTSMIVLTLLYLVLAVVEVALIVRYAKAGPPDTGAPVEPPGRAAGRSDGEHRDGEHRDGEHGDGEQAERPLTFAY